MPANLEPVPTGTFTHMGHRIQCPAQLEPRDLRGAVSRLGGAAAARGATDQQAARKGA